MPPSIVAPSNAGGYRLGDVPRCTAMNTAIRPRIANTLRRFSMPASDALPIVSMTHGGASYATQTPGTATFWNRWGEPTADDG